MAFTGTATVKQVSDRCFRITGLTLATQGASGTIGLEGNTGDVDLNAGGVWGAYNQSSAQGGAVSLIDAVDCRINLVGAAVVAPAVAITKTGTTPADFLVTLTNQGAASTTAMEIYITFET
jgi:hypothetical protein